MTASTVRAVPERGGGATSRDVQEPHQLSDMVSDREVGQPQGPADLLVRLVVPEQLENFELPSGQQVAPVERRLNRAPRATSACIEQTPLW